MKIRLASQTGGGIQFVVTAETDDERVVLGVFERQVHAPGNQFWMHGFCVTCDGKMLGPDSFNFGTIAAPPVLRPPPMTPELKAELEDAIRTAPWQAGSIVTRPDVIRIVPPPGPA